MAAKQAPREITPAQAFGIIADRIQKRKEILKRVSDSGYNIAISELDIVRSQILKAQEYFKSQHRQLICLGLLASFSGLHAPLAASSPTQVAAPTVVAAEVPLYPPLARAASQQGVVVIEVVTDGGW
jgi:hypothetical protein